MFFEKNSSQLYNRQHYFNDYFLSRIESSRIVKGGRCWLLFSPDFNQKTPKSKKTPSTSYHQQKNKKRLKLFIWFFGVIAHSTFGYYGFFVPYLQHSVFCPTFAVHSQPRCTVDKSIFHFLLIISLEKIKLKGSPFLPIWKEYFTVQSNLVVILRAT